VVRVASLIVTRARKRLGATQLKGLDRVNFAPGIDFAA
jgi:hypothetical protein